MLISKIPSYNDGSKKKTIHLLLKIYLKTFFVK